MSFFNAARRWSRESPAPGLSAITALAVLVHGYHLGVDDSAIYVPAIKRVADPNLYPFGAEFFMSHAHLSIFAGLVGGSARLTHLPIDTVIFGWHVASIFLLLLAAHTARHTAQMQEVQGGAGYPKTAAAVR